MGGPVCRLNNVSATSASPGDVTHDILLLCVFAHAQTVGSGVHDLVCEVPLVRSRRPSGRPG